MARTRTKLFRPLSTILKFLLHVGLSLLIVLLHNFYSLEILSASIVENSLEHKAKTLTNLGHEQLEQGKAEMSLKNWSEAYEIYRELNNSNGMTGSLINKSLALQALGLYPRACQTLISALKFENQNWICRQKTIIAGVENEELIDALSKNTKGRIQILGLQNLGTVLRMMGNLEVSEFILKQALLIMDNFSNELDLRNNLLLSLADTESIFYKQALDKYQITDGALEKQRSSELAESKFSSAVDYYEQINISVQKKPQVKLLAQLKQLDLFLDKLLVFASINPYISEESKKQQIIRIYDVTKQLVDFKFAQLPIIKCIHAQIRFANSLTKISNNINLNQFFKNEGVDVSSIALSTTLSAVKNSNKIDDRRAKSLAIGTLGEIYHNLDRVKKSKPFLERALGLAQSIQAWDVAYKWQQYLGRTYNKLDEFERASKAYESAIKSIEVLQNNFPLANYEFIKFNFKDTVEPVYEEYLNILLSRNKPDFEKIIEVKNSFRVAELKNFLQCNQLPSLEKTIDESSHKYSNETIPNIYIFKLEKQVKVIVETNRDNKFYSYTANLSEVTNSVNNLTTLLQSEKFFGFPEPQFLIFSQKLYDRLIAPIRKYLPESGRLVFVLDTYFQNIPFSLLYDGKKYLLESYNISLSLGFQRNSQDLAPKNLKALVAGISQVNPNFSHPLVSNITPLPEVKMEISEIKHNTRKVKELIDADFTSKNFQKWMIKRKTNFPIVHISTHGQFSSDPEKTFILAWDKPINVREFEYLLRNNSNAIDLLVLSACQTAKGDKRSTLGMAGVAVMAGARNTLATLWLVDSSSTAELMGNFYYYLSNGLNKSEALRQAQLTILKNPKYSHPYYWAPFILLGR